MVREIIKTAEWCFTSDEVFGVTVRVKVRVRGEQGVTVRVRVRGRVRGE